MHNAIITFKPGQHFSYHYYINLASDFIFEENTIKFVDFDIDIKIYNKKSFDIVDREEFLENKEILNYPAKLEGILSNEISKIFLLFLQKNHSLVTSIFKFLLICVNGKNVECVSCGIKFCFFNRFSIANTVFFSSQIRSTRKVPSARRVGK